MEAKALENSSTPFRITLAADRNWHASSEYKVSLDDAEQGFHSPPMCARDAAFTRAFSSSCSCFCAFSFEV
jgi:hypothetical protein